MCASSPVTGTALFLTVAFPVLFILIFGLIFSRGAQFEARVGIALEDQGSVAQQLATTLERLPGTESSDDGTITRTPDLRLSAENARHCRTG
jgi:hypothetical protein